MIPLKLVEKTGIRTYTRIFWSEGEVYHEATYTIEDRKYNGEALEAVEIIDSRGTKFLDESYIAQLKWKETCDYCGKKIPETGATYLIDEEYLYDSPPRELREGDIFWDDGFNDNLNEKGHLIVIMPTKNRNYGKLRFDLFSIASNCNHSSKAPHICWNVDWDGKNISTLNVSPSIFFDKGGKNEWHGYIRNGQLQPVSGAYK